LENFDRMSGSKKAALFLMVMGEELTSSVFKHLDEVEIKTIGEQMTQIKKVDPKAISSLLDEFMQTLRGERIVGASGETFFEKTVSKAFNPKKANNLMEDLVIGKKATNFRKLKTLRPEVLVNFISNEHPQTIALILSNLGFQSAAETLKLLPENVQSEVVVRIAKMDGVPDDILSEIQNVLEEQVTNLGKTGAQKLGGIQAAAEILNQVDQKTERSILEKIEEDQEELADEIRQSMFVFEDLINLDDRSIRALLKEVSNDELLVALKTASENLAKKIFGNLSQRAAEMLREDMEVMGPVKVKDVEQAQQNIIKTARRLEEEGKIILGGKGGEDVIV
jgi:flagellar motor switch protein FliG